MTNEIERSLNNLLTSLDQIIDTPVDELLSKTSEVSNQQLSLLETADQSVKSFNAELAKLVKAKIIVNNKDRESLIEKIVLVHAKSSSLERNQIEGEPNTSYRTLELLQQLEVQLNRCLDKIPEKDKTDNLIKKFADTKDTFSILSKYKRPIHGSMINALGIPLKQLEESINKKEITHRNSGDLQESLNTIRNVLLTNNMAKGEVFDRLTRCLGGLETGSLISQMGDHSAKIRDSDRLHPQQIKGTMILVDKLSMNFNQDKGTIEDSRIAEGLLKAIRVRTTQEIDYEGPMKEADRTAARKLLASVNACLRNIQDFRKR